MQPIHDSLPINLLRIREHLMIYFRPILKKHGVTEQQWRIIRYLHEYTNTTIERMSYHVCISSPSLTGVLNRMENMGWLQRRADIYDKRRTYISLTEKGKDLYTKVAPESLEAYKQIEQDFGTAELQILRSIIEVLNTKIQKI